MSDPSDPPYPSRRFRYTAPPTNGAPVYSPAPPISRAEALETGAGISGPDDPSLDPLIAGLYLELALNARDESIRLEAVRDLTRARGHFARAEASAKAKAGLAAAAAISANPTIFASLITGLGSLGLVPPAAAASVAAEASRLVSAEQEDPTQ